MIVDDCLLEKRDTQIILRYGRLEITNYSLKIVNEIFQIRNVTGFGTSEIKSKRIPFYVLLLICLLAWTLGSLPGPGRGFQSFVLWLCLLVGIVYNFKVYILRDKNSTESVRTRYYSSRMDQGVFQIPCRRRLKSNLGWRTPLEFVRQS